MPVSPLALLRQLWKPLLALGLGGCTIATPFRGPGYEPGKGVVAVPATAKVVVALTHATVDSERRAPFDDHTQRVVKSLADQPGLIGYSVRKELLGNQLWTMTVWASEADRARFVGGRVHGQAMAAGVPALKSARFRRLEVTAGEIPLTWQRAEALLEEESRKY